MNNEYIIVLSCGCSYKVKSCCWAHAVEQLCQYLKESEGRTVTIEHVEKIYQQELTPHQGENVPSDVLH